MATCWPAARLPRSRWSEFRRRTVVGTSLALLSHVAAVSDCGRTVGLPYTHICEIVRALHPGARTSVKCLRWYANRCLGGEFDVDLPQARPRSPIYHPLSDDVLRAART